MLPHHPRTARAHVGHHLNLSVSRTGSVLIDNRRFEIRELSAMHNQDGLADRGRKSSLSTSG